jgi:hypothetical protein
MAGASFNLGWIAAFGLLMISEKDRSRLNRRDQRLCIV